MELPRVSILIPCYNAEQWIVPTLESVLKQTWANKEIVVVDDGSTDGSLTQIEQLIGQGKAVRLIKQSNRGASSARNRAFFESTGDFIQYLDADDLIAPEKIKVQMQRLVSQPDCIAFGKWARFQTSPGEVEKFVNDQVWSDLDPVEWLTRSWEHGGGMIAGWLVPRKIIEKVGEWREDLSVNDDGEYFTRVVLAARKILFCSTAYSFYRSGIGGSLSNIRTYKGWQSQFYSMQLCETHLLGVENSERTRRVCSILWQRLAHSCYPYSYQFANKSLKRAEELHPLVIHPDGGKFFRFIKRFLGWKIARILQRLSGRP